MIKRSLYREMLFLSCSVCIISLTGCSRKLLLSQRGNDTPSVITKPPVYGIRIAWDYSTLRKVSASNNARYNGYARVIGLKDKTLICVYEEDGSVVAVKSSDLGNSWAGKVMIAAKESHINMAVPDILQLQDGSILVCYNPRPFNIDPSRKFAIRTKKSYDGGFTWKHERLLYEAGYTFDNGCWEPAAIQLPNGEIQLFFANEGIYQNSNEQNISLLRSTDGGLSWSSNPQIVSFREGKRDGMPSPLISRDKENILFSIEDNGTVNFKPYIIRSKVGDNWSTIVGGNSLNRTYALADKIGDSVYAGAPYLRQLETGEFLMSYQGTENRPNRMANAEMKVVIGSEKANDFNRKTSPFIIPLNKAVLWNSISVVDNNTVIALTSTNAYSNRNTEVWMIKGYIVPELTAVKTTQTIDGLQTEPIWNTELPVFICHKGVTQLRSGISYDDRFLYVATNIKDSAISTTSSDPANNDGVTIYIDAANKGYDKPHTGVFSIFLSADNKVAVKEGRAGKWLIINSKGIKHEAVYTKEGYVQELAIPWDLLLGDKPAVKTRIGFNMSLTENTGKSAPDYRENISSNNENQPYTWLTLKLK